MLPHPTPTHQPVALPPTLATRQLPLCESPACLPAAFHLPACPPACLPACLPAVFLHIMLDSSPDNIPSVPSQIWPIFREIFK
jgi:hypothetical protein